MQPIVRHLGLTDYSDSWQQMQDFTDTRAEDTTDELWFLQHNPVYTLGKNGQPEHVLDPAGIPVVATDRGGQVTYHGPGQLVVYTLLDINRLRLGVRELVTLLEQNIIALLADYSVTAMARREAPGVYVNDAKIAALGLRVRKGRCFHGLALNIDMDLKPFSGINPCGYEDMSVTQLKDLANETNFQAVSDNLQRRLLQTFSR